MTGPLWTAPRYNVTGLAQRRGKETEAGSCGSCGGDEEGTGRRFSYSSHQSGCLSVRSGRRTPGVRFGRGERLGVNVVVVIVVGGDSQGVQPATPSLNVPDVSP